ncbi:MAG: hypothetical protein ACT4OU_08540 [Hyphomicrobium sp.]
MSKPTDHVHASGAAPTERPSYTIGTLVTEAAQHDAMRASFVAGGFSDSDCEYIFIDNTRGAQIDAYRGLNAILNAARAPYVILCHQDVRLLDDDRAALDDRLAELARADPNWAVVGNAGGMAPGQLAIRITDPHGVDQRAGALPARVQTLDENLLIVRRDARIGFSRDLSGFHFYGADICLHAALMGCSAYVIDFHLEHLSPGTKNDDFTEAQKAFEAKWSRALRSRWLQTTCSLVHLSGVPRQAMFGRLIAAPLAKISRRLPAASGWQHRAKAAT